MTLYPVYVGDVLHRDARALGTIVGAWGAGNLATSFLVLPWCRTSVALVSSVPVSLSGSARCLPSCGRSPCLP